METRFQDFTPFDGVKYFTDDKQPKYLTPVNSEGYPLAYLIRGKRDLPERKRRALALYDHHITNKTIQPTLHGYYIEKIGIVPKEDVIYVGETSFN